MKKEFTPRSGSITRRQFLYYSALAASATAVPGCYSARSRKLGAGDKLRIASVGGGGKGKSDIECCAGEEIVAIADVDQSSAGDSLKRCPNAKFYFDWREMLEKEEKNIDAVMVSTPDHLHAIVASAAIKMGKHVYCQKPLTQTVYEARHLRKLAKEHGVVTQMGNQGSSEEGLRRAVEVVQAGLIGPVQQIHVWTNRPIWPQGITRPQGEDPVPANLKWDLWLGPAPLRPFKAGVYHPFAWRGWFDFGTGALGDMACHTVNMPFRALKLGYPNVVECELASRTYPETFPKTSRIRFEFPEREDLPPLKFWWYDGNPKDALKPLRPDGKAIREIVNTYDELPESGALIIGDKGKIFSPDDYGTKFFLAMKGKDEYMAGDQHDACKDIPQTIPRSPGHMTEWFRMMKEGTPAYSNFEIAGYLAEVILLGCVALRVGEGKRMEWDGPNMRSPNLPEAAQFVKRENRAGWEA